jgi:hypothetical protein
VLAQAAVEIGNGRFDESLENTIRVELCNRAVLLRDEIAVLAGVFTTLFKRLQDAHARIDNCHQNLGIAGCSTHPRFTSGMDQAQDSAQQAESAHRSKLQCLVVLSQELDSSAHSVLDNTELLLDTLLSGQQRQFAEAAS